jgi:hypothetical protein
MTPERSVMIGAMAQRATLKSWWQTMLAGGLLGLVVSQIAGEWVLAGLAGFLALHSALIMGIKARKAQGRPWSRLGSSGTRALAWASVPE